MKVLLIVAVLVLGYLFIDLHTTIKNQEQEDYIVKLEVALQKAETRVAVHSNKLSELRVENKLLSNENDQMSATIEGDFYQGEPALDE